MPNPPGPDGSIEPESETIESAADPQQPAERRFTAPGFDAGSTEIIETVPEPATEVIATPPPAQQPAAPPPGPRVPPQLVPPRLANKLPGSSNSWGWVLALVLVILALAAIVVLGTVLLTRSNDPAASQEDQVRDTILEFNSALQGGDLSKLRSITCGRERDNYVDYPDQLWASAYPKIAASKGYGVVASIDQVVVDGDHAEANVTAFTADAPQNRSTRSFDLQFVDGRWKVCQDSSG